MKYQHLNVIESLFDDYDAEKDIVEERRIMCDILGLSDCEFEESFEEEKGILNYGGKWMQFEESDIESADTNIVDNEIVAITKREYDKEVQMFGESSEIFENSVDCDIISKNNRKNIQEAVESVRMSCLRVKKLVLKPKKISDFLVITRHTKKNGNYLVTI